MSRLAIVAAMQEELAAVLALMPDESRQVVGGREFRAGHLHGQPVVAVLSRIGKVAAATTAAVLIERFAVSGIVFVGVAGGLGPGVEVDTWSSPTRFCNTTWTLRRSSREPLTGVLFAAIDGSGENYGTDGGGTGRKRARTQQREEEFGLHWFFSWICARR